MYQRLSKRALAILKLVLPIMQVQKYGEICHMIQRVISGH